MLVYKVTYYFDFSSIIFLNIYRFFYRIAYMKYAYATYK